MASKLKWFNIGLRGLMEAGIIIALGYWGYQTGQGKLMKILLAVGAPLLGFGFWGAVDFHRAGRMAELLRLFQELAISGLAALAWYAAGQQALGWALGLLSVVHHALVYLLGGTLLKH
ncbi:MAG TPA: YrdB family protein [Anaerolineales bacterium]|nr:YrdB family protein [Anaerolineales bacterium]